MRRVWHVYLGCADFRLGVLEKGKSDVMQCELCEVLFLLSVLWIC